MAKTKYYAVPSYLKPFNAQLEQSKLVKSKIEYGNSGYDKQLAEEKLNNKTSTDASPAYKKSYTEYQDFRNKEAKNKIPVPSYLEPQKTGKWGQTTISPKTTTPTVGVGKTGAVKIQPRAFSSADAVLTGALDGASLGVLNGGLNKITGQTGNMSDGNHNIAYQAGKFAGYALPVGKASQALKPVLKGITKPLLNRVAEGAIIGGGMSAIEDTANGKSIKETAKNAGINMALGGALDIGLYGIGKGISKLIKKPTQNVIPTSNSIEPKLHKKPINNAKGILKPLVKEVPQTTPKIEKNIPIAMSEESYLANNGASKFGIGDAGLHKTSKNVGNNNQNKLAMNQFKKDGELIQKREVLRQEYQNKIAQGEIRPLTKIEKLIETANGHSDNESVQAARRLLEKRNIKWSETNTSKTTLFNNPNGKLKPQIIQMKNDTLPLAKRTFENVGDRKVNAYQYDNPTLKPYIKEEANIIKGEIARGSKPVMSGANTIKGPVGSGFDTIGYGGHESVRSESTKELSIATGASYAKINKALDDIIADHGRENNALSKRVELVIDERLSKGYREDVLGYEIPAHGEYLQEKAFIDGMPQQLNTSTVKKSQLQGKLKPKSDMTSVNMSSGESNLNFGTPKNIGFQDTATHTPEGIPISGQPAKVSKVYSNTLQNTDLLSQVEKDMLNKNDFSYDPKTEKMSLDEARTRINNDLNGEINKLNNKEVYSGSDVDTMMGILNDKYLAEANQTGNYKDVKNWLKNVRKAGTEGGRTVQSFAKYTRTTEGKLIEAQRAVDAVEDTVKKNNPALVDSIDKQTKKVINTIDTARGDASKQTLEELLPEEILSNKISGTLKQGPKKNNPITDMVNELFKSAKEAPLPGKLKPPPRNPIDYLRQAIQNKNEYADVWVKSQNLLREKYADNPESLAILDDYFNKGIVPTYSENTLNRSVQTSMKNLQKKLVDIAKSSQGDKEKSLKEITDYLAVTTNATGKDAELLASKIQTRFDEIVKEKSDSILTNMFKDKPKSKQKDIFEKVQELINLGAYDKESIRDLIKQKEGLPVLDSNDIKFITQHMDEANKFPEGSYENRMNMAKVGGLIAEKTPSTGQEKFQAAQRLSMLLNPKSTVVRNPLGNALLNTMESVKNIPGAGIDKVVSKVRGSERTTLLNPILKGKASAEGFKTGIQEWKKDIINAVDTSPVGGGVELPSKVKIFDENASNPVQRTINKSANKIHYVVGKALKLGDTPFYNAAYNERLAELKKIKGTDIITDAMKEDANLYGLERTLQNDSSLAKMFTGFKRADFLKDGTGAKTVYQTFANLILPFAKTPANVLDKFIDYSPVGIGKATGHALLTKGKGTFNQKKFVDTMARGMTGTGLAVLGYLMAKKDLITGARDKNNKVEGFENSLGKANYAFKIGDTYQTVDWALPAAAPLMMGADVYKSMKNSSGVGSALANGVGSGVNLIFNSTLLQGPSKLMGGYNPAASLASGLLGTTTQATPSIGKQVSQLIDPYVRETYDENPLKQTLNKTVARIPFVSKTLPKKVDNLGNEIKAFQGKNNVFNVMLNPGFKTTYNPTDVQKEIIRLYNDSGETSQIPAIAPKVINKTKINPQVNLTGKEMTEYQKMIGLNTLNSYNVIMSSKGYKNGTDEEKAKLLASALEKAKKNATREILKKKNSYWGLD